MFKFLLPKANPKFEYLGLFLILMASVLLGIWATKNTIALRNILLALGSLGSIFYVARLSKNSDIKKEFKLLQLTPLILLAGMFVWVLLHYLFFSRLPEIQFQELKSTWLRTFMAFIFAIGVGVAVRRNGVITAPFLWLGILGSFAWLLIQYVPKAQALGTLMAVDWYGGYYIYIGKINGVLMGTVLLAGLGGAWIDNVRERGLTKSFWGIILFFLALVIVLYAYVFIFDTRNGIGLAALLMLGWLISGAMFTLLQLFNKKSIPGLKLLCFGALIFVLIFSWFGAQQFKRNAGWLTMLDDAKISVQIDKYPHWRNTEKMGFPANDEGRTVAGNTYERVAWATVGLSLVPKNPFGLGVLHRTFTKLLQDDFPGASPPSTHSAWIELTLAFGIPGILMILGSLLALILLSLARLSNPFSGLVLSLGIVILAIYTVGELSVQHAVEILFFLIAFLATVRLPYPKKSKLT